MADIGRVKTLDEVPSIFDFLTRNDMKMTGLRRAAKTTMENGYPKESFTVVFKEGPYAAVKGPAFLFTDGEKDRITADLKTTILPLPIPYKNPTLGIDAPPQLKGVRLDARAWKNVDWSVDEVLCPIHDENGDVVLIEQRWKDENGGKLCTRWSYNDNFEWTHQDPEKFPFWGMDQLKHGATTVYIHEGPKAASAGRRFYDIDALGSDERNALRKHPWFSELSKYPHLGWIGGVNRVSRTMWGHLKRVGVDTVIIIPDNDAEGREAAYDICGFLEGVEVFVLPDYPEYFPARWDLGDGFEQVEKNLKAMDSSGAATEEYQSLPKNLMDITRYWYLYIDPKGKEKPIPLPQYPDKLAYIKEVDRFIDHRNPTFLIEPGKIGRYYAQNLDPALLEKYSQHCATRPGIGFDRFTFKPEQGAITNGDRQREFNKWRPTTVEEVPMDARGMRLLSWVLRRSAVDPLENAILRRAVATTIAKPSRKHFGTIVHGPMGSGKSFLIEQIVMKLVGERFVASPSVDDIASRFNSWREAKTLIYADELKGGQFITTGEIYQRMKRWVTAPTARIEDKGLNVREIPDHATIFANADSDMPLYLERTDRRWFVSASSTRKMSSRSFKVIDRWLKSGGLGQVLYWARNIADDPKAAVKEEWVTSEALKQTFKMDLAAGYVPYGMDAPLTISKAKLIGRSTPSWFPAAEEFCESIARFKGGVGDEWGDSGDQDELPMAFPLPVLVKGIQDHCRNAQTKTSPSERDVESYLKNLGFYIAPIKKAVRDRGDLVVGSQKRIGGKPSGRYTVVMNRAAIDYCIDKEIINEGDVNHAQMTYLTAPTRSRKDKPTVRSFKKVNDMLEPLEYYRPHFFLIGGPGQGYDGDQDGRAQGKDRSHLTVVDLDGKD